MNRVFALFGRPQFLRSFHAFATVSVYANVVGHFSSWQAARVEVRQEEGAE